MSIRAGDSFFAPWPERNAVYHLFFVISDPGLDSDRVLVVPMMTWAEYKEPTCIVEPGEHPFVRHRSYIDYRCAEVVSAKFVEQGIKAKTFRTQNPADATLLDKIRKGAEQSDFLALGHRDILEEQDLVDPL